MLKIKSTYPEIELDWLLLGKGDMIKKLEISNIDTEINIPETNKDGEINFEQAEETTEFAETRESKLNEKHDLIEKITIKQPIRVMLFYQDNTFEFYETKQ